jgi:glycosyltransferase involved in cell wall biosynthesis
VVAVRFSVVVPCYNESAYIADTINSLRAQRFRGGWEIVVVDNNCTDDTAEIARGLGARVVFEQRQGVCGARQRGAEASSGQIIVSADADTIYPPDWLATIDAAFRADELVVAVAGPCRYIAGPLWGRVYGRLLFGAVDLTYRLTGRVRYVTATNLAFCRKRWPGYDVRLTQGGDELDLLRKLRKRGVVRYEHANAVWTSSRRLTRGLVYNTVVTLVVYYLSAYLLNRVFRRRIVGSAPPCRKDAPRSFARRRVAAGVVAVVLILSPVADVRQVVATASHSVLHRLSVLLDPDEGR